jgi:hypothetical protein
MSTIIFTGAQLRHGIAAYEEAVPVALDTFLRHPASSPEAIRSAIGLGGDLDTLASMVGALSGAYLGEEAIPEEWGAKREDAPRLRNSGCPIRVVYACERIGPTRGISPSPRTETSHVR